MVDPSPPSPPETPVPDAAARKQWLRARFRKARREHVAALPQGLRALMLSRPPAPVLDWAGEGAAVGLYHPVGDEAPALGWARWLAENGRAVALPWFADRDAAMTFRRWSDPWSERELEPSPWAGLQVREDAGALVVPDLVVVPLLAFTAAGERLGQGGGHYDRWLAAHPGVRAIGLGWDCQQADALPTEAHDRALEAVVTPTRIYGMGG